MKEHVLSLNDFDMPKVYEAKDANYILIIRLLLLDPGKYQSHPEMGVGLRSKYRFNNNGDPNILAILQNDIKTQMSKYLPEISYKNIGLVLDSNTLGILIETEEGGTYVLGYGIESQDIEAASTYVLSML